MIRMLHMKCSSISDRVEVYINVDDMRYRYPDNADWLSVYLANSMRMSEFDELLSILEDEDIEYEIESM